ncbi:cysteine-rich venom protein TEL1-like [Discoglossus pictus]
MLLIGILCFSTIFQDSFAQGETKLGDGGYSKIPLFGRLRTTTAQTTMKTVNFALDALSMLSTNSENMQIVIVQTHNDLRRQVKPPAENMMKMAWSKAAAKTADLWAKTCKLQHSPPEQRTIDNIYCGENIYMSTSPLSWRSAIRAFYKEKENFIYGKGAMSKDLPIGHYTQLVWHDTTQVGCAVAYCPHNTFFYFYVCQYCPGGNKVNSVNTPYKAGKTCDACPQSCDKGLCTKL